MSPELPASPPVRDPSPVGSLCPKLGSRLRWERGPSTLSPEPPPACTQPTRPQAHGRETAVSVARRPVGLPDRFPPTVAGAEGNTVVFTRVSDNSSFMASYEISCYRPAS